jgi:hypothetical protein
MAEPHIRTIQKREAESEAKIKEIKKQRREKRREGEGGA